MKKRFNGFDIAVVIVLIVIAIATFYKVKEFTGTSAKNLEEKEITITMRVDDVRDVTVEAFMDNEMITASETKAQLGELVKIERMPYRDIAETADGRFVEAEVPNKYTLLLTIKGQGLVTKRGYIMAGYDVKVGKEFHIEGYQSKVLATVWALDHKE